MGYIIGLSHHNFLLLFVLVALLLRVLFGVTIDANPDLGTPFRQVAINCEGTVWHRPTRLKQ